MTRLQVVSLGCRVAGIYILVDQIDMSAVTFFSVLFNRPYGLSEMAIAVASVTFGVKLLLGTAMILFPLWIASWLIPGMIEEETEKGSFSFEEAQLLVFAGLGIYFLVPALFSLISPVYVMLLSGSGQPGYGDGFTILDTILLPVAHLLVGLWLLTGGRGIIKLLQWLRTVRPRP